MELDLVATLCRPSFEDAEAKAGERADRASLLGVFDDFCAGVVFLFHVYTLPQMRRNASDFFIFFYFFSLDKRPRPLPIFEKIQTVVLLLRGGGVKFQSPHHLF